MKRLYVAMNTGWALALLFLGSSCAPHFEIFTAKDFGVLEESYPYDHRATTPDGVVIGVRELKYKKEQGDLEFWTKAVENQLRLDSGYALLETKDVSTKKGLKGKQLRFGIDREGVAHRYQVTIFVTKRGKKQRVYVIEAGGREELVRRHQAQIDWSIAEFIAR
jgi:hypothetical protein